MTTKIDNSVETEYNTTRVDDWNEQVNSRVFLQYKRDRFSDSQSVYAEQEIYVDEDIYV